MNNNKVFMFVPPAHDWSMPLIALPLLKACLPDNIDCRIIDINVELFNNVWDKNHLEFLKKLIKDSFEKNDLISSVDACVNLEKNVLYKKIGEREYILSRKIHTIDEWYNSNKVYEFLLQESQLEKRLETLVEGYHLKNTKAFAISISIEDQIVPAFVLMKILKKKYKHTPIILGGNIISRLAINLENSKLNKYYNALIIGEGEQSLPLVLNNLINSEVEQRIVEKKSNNLLFNNELHINTPTFDDFDLNSYLCPISVLPITLNRKCNWAKCDFCAIHVCWTSGHRERDLDSVISDIRSYIHKYNITFFRIVDENISTKLLGKFAKKLLEENLQIYYEIYTRFDADFLDYQFVQTIYASGCRQIFWGIENINDDALKFMNKGTTQRIIDRTLCNTAKAGILNYCFILTGIPQISEESERETIKYITHNNNIHVVAIGSYVVDKLSPMELDKSMHNKYNISLYNIGDLTTEVGYLYKGKDQTKDAKIRTITYIKEIYSKRPDYALSSLLNEEIRFALTQKYGNKFIERYIAESSTEKLEFIKKEAIARVVEERVLRNSEV